MDISAYRRTYFALVKTLALTDDARHDFNHAQVGKYSTSEFSVSDWRLVVSRLQQLAGQDVTLGNPRMSSQRDGTPGGMISPAQLEYLASLCARIAWQASATAFIRSRVLASAPLRQANWNGQLETLFRSEASAAITAMRRMAGGVQKTA
jgi:hypothetical protein